MGEFPYMHGTYINISAKPPNISKMSYDSRNICFKIRQCFNANREIARHPMTQNTLYYIKMASNSGDVVLDPFCGCGTTIAAAQSLNRTWIGIDNGKIAIQMTAQRPENMLVNFSVISMFAEAVQ